VSKNIEKTNCVLTVVVWKLKWRASISSALPVPTVLSQRNISERETRDDRAETDLAEPEDLLSCFGVTFTTDPDVQSLINSDGTRLVTWIGWHRAMAHLHELDLLELC
jgi:hypothetical protein